jgi:energy-coupling factor transporter ATP-binding protein EcfA2
MTEATKYAEDGVARFSLPEVGVVALSDSLPLLSKMRQNSDIVNETLLPAVIEQSVAPKRLLDVFVEPPLFTESEIRTNTETETLDSIVKPDKTDPEKKERERNRVNLDDVIESDKNILFVGDKESGKSTLLHYIWLMYLEPNRLERAKIPLLVSLKDLPKGRDKIKKAIFRDNPALNWGCELESDLNLGNCVLLVDDLDLDNNKALDAVVKFTQAYPSNRYILAVSEGLFQNLGFGYRPILGVEYESVYIHSFGIKQTRGLIEKWFQNAPSEIRVEDLSEKILFRLSEMGVPRTPMLISLILSIIEQEPNYTPLNKASLLDDLINLLLGRIAVIKGFSGADAKIKKDFLSELAYYLTQEGDYRLNVNQLCLNIIDYFEKRGCHCEAVHQIL